MGSVIRLADHIQTKDLSQELTDINTKLELLSKTFIDVITSVKGVNDILNKQKTTQSEVNKVVNETNKAYKTVNDTEKEVQKIQEQGKKITYDVIKAKEENRKKTKDLTDQVKKEISANKDEVGSINALVDANKKLSEKRDSVSTTTKAGRNEIKAINKEINTNNALIQKNSDGWKAQKMNIGNYSSALGGLPGPLGKVSNGIASMGKQFLMLLANPIVLLIVAIAAALTALFKAFVSTDSGATEFAARMEQVKAIIDVVRQRLAGMAEGIMQLFKGNWKEASAAFKEAFRGIKEQMEAAAKEAYKYAYALDEIEDSENNYISKRAENAKKIAELEFLAQDKTKSAAARKAFLKEAMELGLEEVEFDKNKYKSLLDTELAYLASKSDSRDKVTAEQIKAFILMSDEEQKNASSGLKLVRNNNEAKFKELEDLYAKMLGAETSYFAENKRNLSKMRAAEEEERKEYLQRQLSDIESFNEKEINITKEKYLAGKINEQQMANEIIAIQNQSMWMQLDIAELSAEEKLKITSKLIDAEIELKKNQDATLAAMQKESDQVFIDYEKESANEYAEFEKEQIEESLKGEEEKTAKTKEEIDKRKEFYQDLNDSIMMGAQFAFDTQNILLETESQEIEAEYARRIALAGDNEAAKEAIDKDFDKRRKELKRKQAIADKTQALFTAVINVAQGITAALGMGVPGIILAAVIAALGAYQIASIASRPIPKYAKGLKDNPEGHIGEVGEAGRELVILPDGKSFISEHQLMYIPKHADIIPNYETEKMLNNSGGVSTDQFNKLIEEQKKTREALSKRPIKEVNWTEKGVTASVVRGNSRVTYLNKYFRE
jgi:hypothetical protein